MSKLNFIPKHQTIAEYFRSLIITGKAKPGARLSTDSEIAEKFMVNTRTVAKGMSQLVADGLITRAPGRGSVVVRQKVKIRDSNAVGVVTYSSGHIFRDMAAEITEGLLKHGSYPVWITESIFYEGVSKPDYQPLIKMVEHFINECPQGMIVEGERFVPYDMIRRNLAKIQNLVFIMTYLYKERIPGKYILIDFEEGGRRAAEYFFKNGHRKIIFYPHRQPLREGYGKTMQELIYKGIRQKFHELGGEVIESFFERILNEEDPEEVIRDEYLKTGFTGMLVAYDAIWSGRIAPIFEKLEIRVPDDVSVIGFNNTPWCETVTPRLSSFSIHEKQIGKFAIQMLYDEISAKEIILKPELIERDSVKKLNI